MTEAHPSHNIEWRDSSHHEFRCTVCDNVDTNGGWGKLADPCSGAEQPIDTMDAPEGLHCDDLIDAPGTHPALNAFLEFNRRPAIEQIGETSPELYARYNGEWVRVVMASRFGDLGISYDLDKAHGYKFRVLVSMLTDFSATTPDTTEQATELEYLQWFHGNADFGPADSDVRHYMDEEFMEETGKALPEGYGPEEE